VIGGSMGSFTVGHFAGLAAGVRIVCASDEHKGHGLVSPVIPSAQRDRIITGDVVMEARVERRAQLRSLPWCYNGDRLGAGRKLVSQCWNQSTRVADLGRESGTIHRYSTARADYRKKANELGYGL